MVEIPSTTKLTADHGTFSIPTGLFLNGEWRPAQDDAHIPVVNPATGEEFAAVSDASLKDAAEALDAASAAQEAWGLTKPRVRAELLRKAFDAVIARTEDFAWTMATEMGKPLAEARGEVAYAAEFLRWFSEQVPSQTGNYGPAPDGDYRIITTYQPVGPSLLITPWNFPLAMGTRKVGAALAAGCTVIIKPASQTPLTMHLFVEVLRSVGIPDGVVNLVTTSKSGAQSAALMSDRRLRKVSFTGSTGVGTALLKQAADNVMASSMELGGNGPFLVLSDADVEAAAEGAVTAKFRNAGQACVAANRIIVHKDVLPAFRESFLKRVAELRVGAGTAAGTIVGPLVDGKQRDSVLELLETAKVEGANVLAGGHAIEGEGFFMEPTVIDGVAPGSTIARAEIFGPVAVLYAAESDDDAIDMANDTEYGLVAYLYTQNLSKAMRAAERLEAGMVGINRAIISEAASPFGGIKSSGLGREGGPTGIEEYQDMKYIALTL